MKPKAESVLSIATIFGTNSLVDNVYIHLPFCKKKCHFCAFPVHAIGLQPQAEMLDQYIDALKQEIKLSKPYISVNNSISSLYFGGGTPSLHSHKHFSNIMSELPVTSQTEVTAEVNPTQMASMQGLLNLGINRISLGIQSFNTSILQAMGRHAPNNSLSFILQGLQNCRPPNMNIDFILNFCIGEEDWMQMISFIRQVLPQHLTIYMLQINQGSKLHVSPQMLTQLPNQEDVVSRYIELCQLLKELGYNHYQVSNFSRGAKYRSCHSSTYWKGDKEYLAYGMGATSLTNRKRITRPRSISKYQTYVKEMTAGYVSMNHLEIAQQNSIKDRLSAVIMSGIRTSEGISWQKIASIDQNGAYEKILRKCLSEINEERSQVININQIDKGMILLSPYGFLLGDEIGYRLIQAIQTVQQ